MAIQKTPISLFVYNRPDYARSVLESLSHCERLAECRLFIFSDGPKTPAQAEKVEQTRQVIRARSAELRAEIVERSHNLGLARSIYSGVSDLCHQFGRAIVLEDDFLLSPSFLDYMLQALDRYQDCEQVAQISGYMFPITHPAGQDAFFLPLITTRGWATWDRAWKLFEWDVQGAQIQLLHSKGLRKRFDLDGAYPYSKIMAEAAAGKNDSWAILWWWAVFKSGRLALHPRQSLVWVGGWDGSGVHSGYHPDHWQSQLDEVSGFVLKQEFQFPEQIAEDQAAFKRIKQHLKSRFGQPTLLERIYRRLFVAKSSQS